MRSEIAVKRRTTYKAEEEVIKLEKEKMDQDKLIDSLNEQIKKLSEMKAILSTQLAAQQEETNNAKQILKEAINEKERIETSKKSILEDWQNTLNDIQERDKNLSKLKEFNQEEEMKILTLQSEIQGANREYLNEVEKAENMQKQIDRGNLEADKLKMTKDTLENDLKRLDTKVRMLKESINFKEQEKFRMDIELKEVLTQQVIMEESTVKKQRKIDEMNQENDVNKNLYSANNNYISNMENYLVKADDQKLGLEDNMSILENSYQNLV